jgi:hypothetical protein
MRVYSKKTHLRGGMESISMTLFWVAVITFQLQNTTTLVVMFALSGVLLGASRLVKVDKVFKTR